MEQTTTELRSLFEISYKQEQYYNAKGEMGKDDGGAAPMDVGAVSYDKGKKGGKSKNEKGINKVASSIRRESHRLQRSSMVSAPTVAIGGTRRQIVVCWPRRRPNVMGKAKEEPQNLQGRSWHRPVPLL